MVKKHSKNEGSGKHDQYHLPPVEWLVETESPHRGKGTTIDNFKQSRHSPLVNRQKMLSVLARVIVDNCYRNDRVGLRRRLSAYSIADIESVINTRMEGSKWTALHAAADAGNSQVVAFL